MGPSPLRRPKRGKIPVDGHATNVKLTEEEHPRCCQEKGSKVEERLVHLMMVVKFEVLIEKKKMCYLGLMRFDWLMGFLMVNLEELGMNKLLLEEEALVKSMVGWVEEDKDDKKSRKDGLFN
ncbi:hypothetical protein Tco_0127761 [Tanacetum coccineum]